MLFFILLLLISIPLVSPSYHIPKLGRYHTFLRIGKRQFTINPCIEPSLCQPRIDTKCVRYFNRRFCWDPFNEDQMKAIHHRDNT